MGEWQADVCRHLDVRHARQRRATPKTAPGPKEIVHGDVLELAPQNPCKVKRSMNSANEVEKYPMTESYVLKYEVVFQDSNGQDTPADGGARYT